MWRVSGWQLCGLRHVAVHIDVADASAVVASQMTHNGYYTLWIESFNDAGAPEDSFSIQGASLIGK